MFTGPNSWRNGASPSTPYTSSSNRRANHPAPPSGGPRHLSPPAQYDNGAPTPHRYEVGALQGPCRTMDSAGRGSFVSGSTPGMSGQRGSFRGSSTPTTAEFTTPYSSRRSPTQLRYFEEARQPHDRQPVTLQYAPPPPLARTSPWQATTPTRGTNVFDQDQIGEGTNTGGVRSASAAALAAMNHHSPHGRGGGYSPQQGSNYGGARGYPTQRQAPSPAPSQRPMPRIHLSDYCNTIVEDRDRQTGHVRATYRCGTLLGTGGFAKVYHFTDCATGEGLACKVIEKAMLSESSTRAKFAVEIDVHRRMQHPNILKFVRAFEDDFYHYILLERCCRQNLMDLSRSRRTFTVEETQFILYQLLQAVEFLHSNRVIHRDLKLGNVMIDMDGNMKIGDFGFATELHSDTERKRTMCGTPNYIAPEILTANRDPAGYSYEADIWSLGVILYTLMVGDPPFETNTLETTYSRIKRCDYKFPPTCKVPDSGKELIRWMLQRDPQLRPQLVQIRNHHFMRYPECPRVAPSRLVNLDPEMVPNRNSASPYAEAGRSSSPIQETLTEIGSPLMPRPLEVPIEYAVREPLAFSPPPAFREPLPTPTPYHFTPVRNGAQDQNTFVTPPPHPTEPAGAARGPLAAPRSITSPFVNRLLYADPMEAVTPQHRENKIDKVQPPHPQTTAEMLSHSSSTSSTASSDRTNHKFDTSSDGSQDVLHANEADVPDAVSTAPPPPRAFFTDMVHFPRYGFGFQTWDLRNSAMHRTKSIGAYLNDKTKLVRDARDDTVWYFARVRDDGTGRGSQPTPFADAASPRCFFDQLHQFIGGAHALDPKSSVHQPLSPFLQSQNVFKKYTIVKFIETYISAVPWGGTPTEASYHATSALKSFFLEPHQDIYCSQPRPSPPTGDVAAEITFVKEASIAPITELLPPSHALGVELVGAPSHRIPLMAAARFSDLSFQVSLSAVCPSSLQITPQVFGVRSVSAVSQWKLDVILYDTCRMSITYRADDDVYALSVADVALKKRRGFGGSIVFNASSSFPRDVNAILIPETTIGLIVAMLRRVRCPEDLVSGITVAV